MSYRDFDRGLTAEEVRKKKLAGVIEKNTQEEARLFKESEHRMNIVRQIKAWNHLLDEEVKKKWQEVTKKK